MYLSKVSDQGYSALVTLGSRGFNYATNVVLNTAIKVRHILIDIYNWGGGGGGWIVLFGLWWFSLLLKDYVNFYVFKNS